MVRRCFRAAMQRSSLFERARTHLTHAAGEDSASDRHRHAMRTGDIMAIRIAMIAITTNSSIRVKPRVRTFVKVSPSK